MPVRKRFVLAILISVFVLLTPTRSQAAYTWPTVTPTSGGNGSGISQSFGAIINWGSSDDPITSIGAYAYVNIGSSNVTCSYTPNIGNLQATVLGTVTFDPGLTTGDQYTIVITATTDTMSFYVTTIVLTVP